MKYIYYAFLFLLGFIHKIHSQGTMPPLPKGGAPPVPQGVQGPGGIGSGPLGAIRNALSQKLGESTQVGGNSLPGPIAKCPALKDLRGVTRDSNETTVYAVVSFECKEGFEKVSGSDSRTCQKDRKWSGTPLVCTEVSCPALDIANAKANTTANIYGTVVKFTCNSGFLKVGGDDERRCTSDRIWTGKDIQCKSNTCAVPSVPNASSSPSVGSKVAIGASVTYSCNTGFKTKSGNTKRTCTKMETWSGVSLQCEATNCPTLSVPNGILSTTATTIGTVVDMECNDQYRKVSGNKKTKCEAGKWSKKALVCQRGIGFQDPPEVASTNNCGGFCQGSNDIILVPGGDANGDGYHDLICHKSSGQIHVALNNKKGGFTCGSNPAQGIESKWCKGYRQKAFLGDFDGDKRADLLCHSYSTGSKDVRLRKTGTGNAYSNPTNEAFGGWCYHSGAELHVADFDGDDKADLLCHDNRTGYKWLAKGGFPQKGIVQKQAIPMRWCCHSKSILYVADSNGDGSSDISCHDDAGNLWVTQSSKCTNNAKSTWYTQFIPNGGPGYSAKAGDFFGHEWYNLLGTSKTATAGTYVLPKYTGDTPVSPGPFGLNAFELKGTTSSYISVTNTGKLNFGSGSWTVGTFFYQSSTSNGPILEWRGRNPATTGLDFGTHFWMWGNTLFTNLDAYYNGGPYWHWKTPTANTWHFVGASYNHQTGNFIMWDDEQCDMQPASVQIFKKYIGSLSTRDQHGDVYIGRRPANPSFSPLRAKLAGMTLLKGAILESEIPSFKAQIIKFAGSLQMTKNRAFCADNTKAQMPRYHLMDFNGDSKADMYCHRTASKEENCVLVKKTGYHKDSETCGWKSTKDYCNTKGDLLIFGKYLQSKRDDILCIRKGVYLIVRNYGL